MISKKQTRGKCPFRNLKECSPECVFFRKGVRFNEKKQESYPFEECAINIIADNLEAMHQRTYAMQKEVGETKNIMAFKILSDLGRVTSSDTARIVAEVIDMPEDKKLLK